MAASNSTDRQTFLSHLRESGLLADEDIARIASEFANQPRGRVIARTLVERGILTRFQAERLLIGRTTGFLLGQYRILEQLGRGGMGRVYKAEHRTMHRIVALKVLSADVLSTERAVQLFLHEVRAVAQIVHPNIVAAFDANEINGRYYLVLEYVDGPNLEQLVRKEGPLSVGLACDYVRQVAHGLQSALAKGMVHRDIKPANILVQRQGVSGDSAPGMIKISDFGLARLTQPLDAPTSDIEPATIVIEDNMVMGTPDYISPEQTRSLHGTDIRSDLYSLGCTFYFLLTGSVPFPGGSSMNKLIRHATEKPAPITNFRSDVPAEVAAILDRLLAKDPADRFSTPALLAEALRPYSVSGPTPWEPSQSAPSLPFVDTLATPADIMNSDTRSTDLEQADAELAALSSPLSGSSLPRLIAARRIASGDRISNARLQIAVFSAIVIVSGLLVLTAVMSLLSR